MSAEHSPGDTESLRLAERLITAEQDERRRLALFLHDGPVQALSGIALMLDAALDSIEEGRPVDAKQVLAGALARHRATIRSLRDLSFNLEPVVLRDQGFGMAVRALADQIVSANGVEIELDVEAGEALAEKAQAAVYQVVREALNQAVQRGSAGRIAVRIARTEGGGFELAIVDDGAGERRRASFEAIAERAQPFGGRVTVDSPAGGGTEVRVALPPYAARE